MKPEYWITRWREERTGWHNQGGLPASPPLNDGACGVRAALLCAGQMRH
ncbi:MAG TPA: hypothetical protein VFM97_06345 [Gammaproteobacteria bacterium]|nr:hypothetical protein [Gammaproteobacteria bacterium]